MTRLRGWSLAAAALFLVLLLAGWLVLTHAKTRLAAQFPLPGRLTDIGGYRLHLHCLGTGKTTVVLEAGLNELSLAWRSGRSFRSRAISAGISALALTCYLSVLGSRLDWVRALAGAPIHVATGGSIAITMGTG